MTPNSEVPHDFGAEQAVIGNLLMQNSAAEKILWLKGEHFADGLHGMIFDAAMALVAQGKAATPVTLKHHFFNFAPLAERGGDGFLVGLAACAVSPVFLVDYARVVFNTHLRRVLIGLAEDIANRAYSDPDVEPQIADAVCQFDELGSQVGQDGLRSALDFRDDVRALFHGKRKIPISTGFRSIDPFYRIRPGELSVVTGAPSSGKSEFIDAVAVNLAMREGWKVAVCSFENSPDEHVGKLCEKYLGMPFHEGPSPRMTEADLDRAEAWVNDHFWFIRAEKDSPTIEWALSRARQAVDAHRIQGLILDPYNEFEHRRPAGMREDEYISQSLGAVKRFASNHGVHVWFVAHPAKPARDQRDEVPSLYDISGGAQWGNKADCGITVYRPFLDSGERSREVEIHVKKIRFRVCGKPGIARLEFIPSMGRYREVAPPTSPHWSDDQ